MTFGFWTAYWTFVSFVFGAIVGSFLNVCIWRLPRGESLWSPPSHCPACGHRLRLVPDMVPMLSQLWYRSRCRYCGERFSWRYFWVEVLTAALFAAVYVRYTLFAPPHLGDAERLACALAGMAFVAALVVIFFIDLEHYEIPDGAVLVAVAAAVAKDGYLIATGARPLFQPVPGTPWQAPVPLSVLTGLIAFWLLWQFAALGTAALGREAMGAGDSLLLGAMGAFLIPWPLLALAFMAAVALGMIGGLAGLWLAKRTEPAPQSDGSEAGPVESAPDAAPPEAGVPSAGGSLRGSVPLAPAPDPGDEFPELPPESRWGRLWTVCGTWVAVGGLWGAAVVAATSLPLAVLVGVATTIGAALLLRHGIRLWVRGDREWLPAMDTLFEEGDPGPRCIPFGPYLVVGTLLAIFFGRPLVEWYARTQLGITTAGLPWD